MALLGPDKYKRKQNLWKWWTNLDCVGHNGPTSCEIGLMSCHENYLVEIHGKITFN